MAKAEARIWHFGLTVGYWQAHRFISVYGSPLFGAVSNSKSNTTIDRPHMAFAHLEYAQSLGRGFSWGYKLMLTNIGSGAFTIGQKMFIHPPLRPPTLLQASSYA